MTDNQLSGKELYEQQKREKERNRGNSQPSPKSSERSAIWPWVVTLLVLAAMVFGIYKLATLTPPGGVASSTGSLSIPVGAGDHTLGSQTAPVQLVEYADFQCPACAYYAPWVKRLGTDFPASQLGITFRHFPLNQIHNNAQIAAQVAEAAGQQGKFWEAVELIYKAQDTWADQLSARDTLIATLAPLQLNQAKLKADIDSAVVSDKITADSQSGVASGVDGTPSFFINGRRIENPRSYEAFRQLVVDAAAAQTSTTNASSTSQ